MLLYPCDQTAKNSSWRDNCPAQSHPTKKEGQSSQLGITIRSFSDCQRRGLARCDHVGRSIRDLPWTPSEQGGASRAPPPNSKYISLFIQSKEFNLLIAGCLPCIVQLWERGLCPSERRQTNKWKSQVQADLRDTVGSRLSVIKQKEQ